MRGQINREGRFVNPLLASEFAFPLRFFQSPISTQSTRTRIVGYYPAHEPQHPARGAALSTETAPWYQEGLQFTCTRCGNCCGGAPGYVWVDDEEIVAIAKFLKLPEDQFRKRHVRKVFKRQSLRELKNGDCEFLTRDTDGKAACSIHKVRPIQCRTWPFWKSNLESPETWEATGEECPGINQGQHHALPVIQKQVYAGASRPL